jgi:hypothetical protein
MALVYVEERAPAELHHEMSPGFPFFQGTLDLGARRVAENRRQKGGNIHTAVKEKATVTLGIFSNALMFR